MDSVVLFLLWCNVKSKYGKIVTSANSLALVIDPTITRTPSVYFASRP
jgi:hypothetical protein